jgi:hypothetical protein
MRSTSLSISLHGGLQHDVARDDDDADTPFEDRAAHRGLEHARHLRGSRAFLEQLLGMGLLEIAGADLRRGDLGGDGDDGKARAMAVARR